MRKRVTSNGLRGKAIESPTESTSPSPLLLITVCIVVSPAILAPRQQVAVGSVHRRDSVLVLGSERRQRHAPRQPRRLLRVPVRGESGHRRANRHWRMIERERV